MAELEVGAKIYRFLFIHEGNYSLKKIEREELVCDSVMRGTGIMDAGIQMVTLRRPDKKPTYPFSDSLCIYREELNKYLCDLDSAFLFTDDIQKAKELYQNYLQANLERTNANIINQTRQIEMLTHSVNRDKAASKTIKESLKLLEELEADYIEERD